MNNKIHSAASKEQEFIRAQERHLARQLMGLGRKMLRKIKVESANVSDLCRVVKLASRLGRLGSGLPLVPVEETRQLDLNESLMTAIDRAYGPEPKAVIDAPAIVPPCLCGS
jgi:hypothetical protein